MPVWGVVIVGGEPGALNRPVAGVPLWKRLVLTLCQAGIRNFFFLADLTAGEVDRMQQGLASDQRFEGEAFWLRREEAEGSSLPAGLLESRFLLVSAEALLDPLLLRRFLISAWEEDPLGRQNFALVDARRPFPCPSMAQIRVTQCYWRKGSPVAFCPSHVFHPVEFAGAFICPPELVSGLLEAWQRNGWVGLMGTLGDSLEAGCRGYLVTGRQVVWPGGDREKSRTRAESAVVSQLRVYRSGRIEGVLLGRLSGWLALALSRVPPASVILAVLSLLTAGMAALLLARAGYLSGLVGAALVVCSVTLKLAVEDLGRLRFESSRRVARLSRTTDAAAKSLPLFGIAAGLLEVSGRVAPGVTCILTVLAYFFSTTWPVPGASRRLRLARRQLRGHSFLYLLVPATLIGRQEWFLWASLAVTWLVGCASWIERRRRDPLTRVVRLI